MAIAEMSRMKLLGVKSEEEKILSALHKTCSVQIISNGSVTEGFLDSDGFVEKFDRLNFACDYLFNNVNRISKEVKGIEPIKEEVYPVTYDEFVSALSIEEKIEPVVSSIYAIRDAVIENKAELIKLNNEKSAYKPFIGLKSRFSAFSNTIETRTFLGTIKTAQAEAFLSGDYPCSAFIECEGDNFVVLSAVCLKQDESLISGVLSGLGFNRTNFNGDFTAKDKCDELTFKINEKERELKKLDEELLSKRDYLKQMKILLDRYSFEIEKAEDKEGFSSTDGTFLLEAFIPTEATDRVEKAISEATDKVFTEFAVVPKDEFAPTLMKNKKLTKQFEFITNLYSPPKYGTIDQNFVMMIFFSVFMGFIMADMGYGVMMTVGGLIMAKKIGRDTGTRRLCNIIAFGGIFTFVFGALFDSFFGYGLLRAIGVLSQPIMPDAINHKLNLAGISVPTLLLLSLGMGVVQIIASLLMKAASYFRDGKILDGIFEGVVWAAFLVGLVLLVVDFAGLTQGLSKISAIIMVVSVVIGALTAGRHEKGFGKFSKAFSSVYGLINYMSDILSYARLYGLMLSGAQIATIVTTLSLPLMTNVGGVIGGTLILIVGHLFNLAMGLLGAYIHDSRLQYIEFYGRFYEGEGELFQPFGTKFDNIYFADAQK